MGLRKWLKRLKEKLTRRGKMNYDIFILSFPKCGRTWLALQIARAIQQHFGLADTGTIKLSKMAELCKDAPRIRIAHDDSPHRKKPFELAESKKKYAGKKVIFLARDPRDVLVSSYFHRRKSVVYTKPPLFGAKTRKAPVAFEGELSDFIHTDAGGFDTLLRFYNIWAKNRHVPKDFLLVRYEDMHADPQKQLARIMQFIGMPDVSTEVIDEAVRYASFDNMRNMEKADRFKVRPAEVTDESSFKVRRGKVKGYIDYLKPEEVELLNRKMASTLTDFYGYEPSLHNDERGDT